MKFYLSFSPLDPKIDTIDFQSTITKNFLNLKAQKTVIFDKVSMNEGNAYDNIHHFFWNLMKISFMDA